MPILRTGSAVALVLGLAAPSLPAQPLVLVERETAGSLAAVPALALSANGAALFAVSPNAHALSAFDVDGGGTLALADVEVDGAGLDGLRQAQTVAVSPDGAHVYVAARGDDAVAVFARDAGTGALTWVESQYNETGGVEGIWQTVGVAVSTDGDWVLVSGRKSPSQPKGGVALFARDSGTGALTFAHAIFDDFTPGVSGLGNGATLWPSPDGAHVYAASPTGNAVAILAIDDLNGELDFLGSVVDGAGGVDGLGGASGVAFDASGGSVYVTGSTDGALAVFERHPASGQLDFLEVHVDGIAGVDGLAGAAGVAVTPAGERVFAAGPTDNAVAIFVRSGDGRLMPIAVARDGVDGLDGLGGARSPRVSNDGVHLYVAASGEAAIGVFEIGDAFDFGDAPDPAFPTLLASNGARHVISGGLRLGAAIDAEADGRPDPAAAGDDGESIDDEDGVVFTGALVPGQSATAAVSSGAPGLLDAWIDFDGDGAWSGTGERIASALPLVAGANVVAFTVPPTALPSSNVFARFRLSSAGVAGPEGLAADGEVEDYLVPIGQGADLGVAVTPSAPSDWALPYGFVVTVSNAGPNDVVDAAVDVFFSANGGGVTWTCTATDGDCTGAGVGDIDDLVDLLPGGTAVYTVAGVIPDEAPGPYVTADATVAAPAGVTDPVAANDSASAGVLIVSIFLDGFETGDTVRWSAAVP